MSRSSIFFGFGLVIASLTACGDGDTPTTDGGRADAGMTDAGGRDAQPVDALVADGPRTDAPPADSGLALDGSMIDAAIDAGPCVASCGARQCGDDGCGGTCGTCLDGASCDTSGICDCPASSCGSTATCGASSCGRVCGVCGSGEGCFMGSCIPVGTCPGTPCTDRRGGAVCEGQRGIGQCRSVPAQDAVCTCTGGGETLNCDPCIPGAPVGTIGAVCTTGTDCPAGVPCAPGIGLCGAPCDPASVCARGACFVPGDVSGVCLDECSCDVPGTCAPGMRCVDTPTGVSSVCLPEARATGLLCTRGG